MAVSQKPLVCTGSSAVATRTDSATNQISLDQRFINRRRLARKSTGLRGQIASMVTCRSGEVAQLKKRLGRSKVRSRRDVRGRPGVFSDRHPDLGLDAVKDEDTMLQTGAMGIGEKGPGDLAIRQARRKRGRSNDGSLRHPLPVPAFAAAAS
jgi:hypothetical protein